MHARALSLGLLASLGGAGHAADSPFPVASDSGERIALRLISDENRAGLSPKVEEPVERNIPKAPPRSEPPEDLAMPDEPPPEREAASEKPEDADEEGATALEKEERDSELARGQSVEEESAASLERAQDALSRVDQIPLDGQEAQAERSPKAGETAEAKAPEAPTRSESPEDLAMPERAPAEREAMGETPDDDGDAESASAPRMGERDPELAGGQSVEEERAASLERAQDALSRVDQILLDGQEAQAERSPKAGETAEAKAPEAPTRNESPEDLAMPERAPAEREAMGETPDDDGDAESASAPRMGERDPELASRKSVEEERAASLARAQAALGRVDQILLDARYEARREREERRGGGTGVGGAGREKSEERQAGREGPEDAREETAESNKGGGVPGSAQTGEAREPDDYETDEDIVTRQVCDLARREKDPEVRERLREKCETLKKG